MHFFLGPLASICYSDIPYKSLHFLFFSLKHTVRDFLRVYSMIFQPWKNYSLLNICIWILIYFMLPLDWLCVILILSFFYIWVDKLLVSFASKWEILASSHIILERGCLDMFSLWTAVWELFRSTTGMVRWPSLPVTHMSRFTYRISGIVSFTSNYITSLSGLTLPSWEMCLISTRNSWRLTFIPDFCVLFFFSFH